MTVCGSHKKPIWNTINIPSFPWHMVCCAAPKGPPGTAIMVAKVFCNITESQWMETNETFQMKIGTEHCCRAKGHRLCIFFTPSVHPRHHPTTKHPSLLTNIILIWHSLSSEVIRKGLVGRAWSRPSVPQHLWNPYKFYRKIRSIFGRHNFGVLMKFSG